MSQPLGAFVMVLHGHIPYVLGHSTWPHGSMMLYEAAAETYLPLLWSLEELVAEGISPNITMSLSPITVEQLSDPRFKRWFESYLSGKMQVAGENAREFERHRQGHLAYLAQQWQGRYRALREAFIDGYGRDIVGAFRRMQDDGHIEVMTCAATHGYLPLLHEDVSVQAQILQAVENYERHFGRRPRAIWLPECAYRPKCHWAPPPRSATPRRRIPARGSRIRGRKRLRLLHRRDHMLARPSATGGGPARGHAGQGWSHLRPRARGLDLLGANTPYRPYFVGQTSRTTRLWP